MGYRCHPHARGHSPITGRRPLLGNYPTHACSLASPARLAVNISLPSYVSSSRDDDIEDILSTVAASLAKVSSSGSPARRPRSWRTMPAASAAMKISMSLSKIRAMPLLHPSTDPLSPDGAFSGCCGTLHHHHPCRRGWWRGPHPASVFRSGRLGRPAGCRGGFCRGWPRPGLCSGPRCGCLRGWPSPARPWCLCGRP